ncbi:MAG TPA: hypothetical protein VIY54_13215 [Steroidobacteraceae bacterium]
MKKLMFAAALLGSIMTASAQSPTPNAPHLLMCLYAQDGALTSFEAAPPGAKPGTRTEVGSGGEHGWSYTVAGSDLHDCPDRLPVSSKASDES